MKLRIVNFTMHYKYNTKKRCWDVDYIEYEIYWNKKSLLNRPSKICVLYPELMPNEHTYRYRKYKEDYPYTENRE